MSVTYLMQDSTCAATPYPMCFMEECLNAQCKVESDTNHENLEHEGRFSRRSQHRRRRVECSESAHHIASFSGLVALGCSGDDPATHAMDAERGDIELPRNMVDTETPTDIHILDAGSTVLDMERGPADVLPPDVDMLPPLRDMTALPVDMGVEMPDMSPQPGDASQPSPEVIREDDRLENWRAMYDFPGITAMVFADGEVIARGVAGVRMAGGDTVVEDSDRFHIGSCTKAMTATLLGRFVDAGSMSFDDTLGEIFADLEIHEGFRQVTLGQLIRHLGGTPGALISDYPELWRFMRANEAGDQRPVRLELTRTLLREGPTQPVGNYTYSNSGYIIVGAAIERVIGRPWEDLMVQNSFNPLGMDDCGFGGAASAGAVDHPWAHRRGRQNENVPVDPAGIDDNPRSLGPAGTVHRSMDSGSHS